MNETLERCELYTRNAGIMFSLEAEFSKWEESHFAEDDIIDIVTWSYNEFQVSEISYYERLCPYCPALNFSRNNPDENGDSDDQKSEDESEDTVSMASVSFGDEHATNSSLFEQDEIQSPILLNACDKVYYVKGSGNSFGEWHGSFDTHPFISFSSQQQMLNEISCRPNTIEIANEDTVLWASHHSHQHSTEEETKTKPGNSAGIQQPNHRDPLAQAMHNAGITESNLDLFLTSNNEIESTFSENNLFSLECQGEEERPTVSFMDSSTTSSITSGLEVDANSYSILNIPPAVPYFAEMNHVQDPNAIFTYCGDQQPQAMSNMHVLSVGESADFGGQNLLQLHTQEPQIIMNEYFDFLNDTEIHFVVPQSSETGKEEEGTGEYGSDDAFRNNPEEGVSGESPESRSKNKRSRQVGKEREEWDTFESAEVRGGRKKVLESIRKRWITMAEETSTFPPKEDKPRKKKEPKRRVLPNQSKPHSYKLHRVRYLTRSRTDKVASSTSTARLHQICCNNNSDHDCSSDTPFKTPSKMDESAIKRKLLQNDKALMSLYDLQRRRPEMSTFVDSMMIDTTTSSNKTPKAKKKGANNTKHDCAVKSSISSDSNNSKIVPQIISQVETDLIEDDVVDGTEMPPCIARFVSRMRSDYGDFFTNPGPASRERRLRLCDKYLYSHGVKPDSDLSKSNSNATVTVSSMSLRERLSLPPRSQTKNKDELSREGSRRILEKTKDEISTDSFEALTRKLRNVNAKSSNEPTNLDRDSHNLLEPLSPPVYTRYDNSLKEPKPSAGETNINSTLYLPKIQEHDKHLKRIDALQDQTKGKQSDRGGLDNDDVDGSHDPDSDSDNHDLCDDSDHGACTSLVPPYTNEPPTNVLTLPDVMLQQNSAVRQVDTHKTLTPSHLYRQLHKTCLPRDFDEIYREEEVPSRIETLYGEEFPERKENGELELERIASRDQKSAMEEIKFVKSTPSPITAISSSNCDETEIGDIDADKSHMSSAVQVTSSTKGNESTVIANDVVKQENTGDCTSNKLSTTGSGQQNTEIFYHCNKEADVKGMTKEDKRGIDFEEEYTDQMEKESRKKDSNECMENETVKQGIKIKLQNDDEEDCGKEVSTTGIDDMITSGQELDDENTSLPLQGFATAMDEMGKEFDDDVAKQYSAIIQRLSLDLDECSKPDLGCHPLKLDIQNVRWRCLNTIPEEDEEEEEEEGDRDEHGPVDNSGTDKACSNVSDSFSGDAVYNEETFDSDDCDAEENDTQAAGVETDGRCKKTEFEKEQ